LVLTPAEARAFYDRFGKKQDAQGLYEDRALDELIAHGGFAEARKVLEFGCGTGRLAARLLAQHLPATAAYVGLDVSSTMVNLARERLTAYKERAEIVQSEGVVKLPVPDHSVDRVVSTYVLDLLSEADIAAFLQEAHRVLTTGGKLCLVSLTKGRAGLSRLVSSLWSVLFRLRPSLVGGCRPICLAERVDPSRWTLEYGALVTSFGVPSEILVASVPARR
jgi:ubiquinone/menaquinone biosynthesis C-methylase UbiE